MLLVVIKMIEIFQGLVLKSQLSTEVFFDYIFDDATVDKVCSTSPDPLFFNWKHPGCHWMVLE